MAKFFCPFFFLVFFFVFFFVQAEICVENTVVYPVVDDVRTKVGRYGVHKTVDFDTDFYRNFLVGGKHVYKTVYDRDTVTPFVDTLRTVRDVPFMNTNRNFMDTPFVDNFRTVRDMDTMRTVRNVPFMNNYRNFMDTPFVDNFRTVRDMDTMRTVRNVPFMNNFMDMDTMRTVRNVPFLDMFKTVRDVPFVDTYKTVRDVYTPRRFDVMTGRRFMNDDTFFRNNVRVFDFSNDVGDYVRTVEGFGTMDIDRVLDVDRVYDMTVDRVVDRTYRMDFFKDNFNVLRTKMDCDCVCPNTIPTGDFTDKVMREVVRTDLINKLWNNKRMPKLSLLGKRMKFVTLSMVNSDDRVLRKTAFLFTAFMHSHLAFLDVTTLCPFTKVVEMAVDYETNRDVTLLREVFHLIGKVVDVSTRRLATTTVVNGGCVVPNDFMRFVNNDVTTDVCNVDNVHNHFMTVFARYGKFLPVTYRRVVEDLFRSTYLPDRFMATVATFVLTKEVRMFVKNYDTYKMFELVNMLGTEVVPECCCNFRTFRLRELVDLTNMEVVRTVDRLVRTMTTDVVRTDDFMNVINRRVMGRFF